MSLFEKDKLLHVTICFLITVLIFSAISAARRFYGRYFMTPHFELSLAAEHDTEAAARGAVMRKDKTSFSYKLIQNNLLVVLVANLVALSIGIVKEIGDMYNIWWLCQSKNEDESTVGCDASWVDFIADIVGIILANFVIFTSLWLCHVFTENSN